MGTVIEQDDNYVTVRFPSKTSKFMYPIAFEKFLTLVDSADVDAIEAEIVGIKAAKAAEAARKAAEEQAGLEVLRQASEKKPGVAKAYQPVKRVAGQALTYLVFQGDTYNEERTEQFIWAPEYTKDGRTMHHWDRLMDVRVGDVIFHSSDGYI